MWRLFTGVAIGNRMRRVSSPDVAREVPGLRERHGADDTTVRTVAGVNPNMADQRGPVVEPGKAGRTDESANAGGFRCRHLVRQ